MSTPPATAPTDSPRPRPRLSQQLRDFWQRVSEGRQIEDLWSQLHAEARASYGLYSRDVDWGQIQQASTWKRPFYIVKALFLAMLMKLSPARRVLLLAALLLLLLSGIGFQYGQNANVSLDFRFLSALLLFLLLALELADRVTMKRDLEIAREIQGWLLPSAPPVVPGAEIAFAGRPQNTVAGDYYDAFYRGPAGASGSKLLLVVADVAGKSVPAALLMATLQASLRSLAAQPAGVADLLAGLNRYVCAHSQQGRRFTTAIVAEYDPQTRELAYINAGHNAPVLRRSSGRIERLDVGGVPLGVDPDATYESASLRLGTGDLLVFFTDGVVEAFNEKGAEFGETRWLAAISSLGDPTAATALGQLMAAVDEFVGATRQFDDITCMIFKVAALSA